MGFFDLSLLDAYVRDNSPTAEEKPAPIVACDDDYEGNYWEPVPLNFLDSAQDGLPRPFKWKMEDECNVARQVASNAVSSSGNFLHEDRGKATTLRSVRSRSGDAILSREQCEVMDLVSKGENVFFTGPGGTGKSFVLKCVIETLKDKFSDPHSPAKSFAGTCGCFSCNVAVTASTGIAALAIGGSTLHSAAGIGIPRRIRDFGRMFHTELRAKWRRLKVLIIDEISMISAETLEYLEQTLCRLREEPENEISSNQPTSPVGPRPFGGLQVILAGDFFQLLPVVSSDNSGRAYSWDELTNRGIAFQAPAWHKGNFRTIFLTKAFRQDREDEFVTLLEDIRTGRNPSSVDKIVHNCERMLPYQHGIKPTKLFPRSLEVKELNDKELARLCSHEEVYVSIDSYDTVEASLLSRKDSSQPDTSVLELHDAHNGILEGHIFWKYCQAERIVRLKVGAQVMLLRNLRRPGSRLTLVNGSRGVIVGWTTKERALANLGQRANAGGDLFGRNKFEYESVKILEKCGLFVIPRVKFRNGEILDIVPMAFDHEVVNVGECRRIQIPLKLAWAITIHKSQGMTLDYAKVALSGVFAEGQAYVALSRVKSMDSLQVLNTNSVRSVVRVNNLVRTYFEDIQNGTGEKPKIIRFRTIRPLYTGRKKSDNSRKEATDDSKELADGRNVHAKHSLNAECESTESKALQKVDQHLTSPSGRKIPADTYAAVANKDQKSQNLFVRVKTEKDDMCVSGDAIVADERVIMSPVQPLNKIIGNVGCRDLGSSLAKSPKVIQSTPSDAIDVKRDADRVTGETGRNVSLPPSFGDVSLSNGESMHAFISRNVSGLAKEIQGMLELDVEKPFFANQRRRGEGMMPERRGEITNKENSPKVPLTFGRVRLEEGVIESAQAKVDTRTNKTQAHTEFTNQNSRPYHYPEGATGSGTGSAAHSHRNGEPRVGKGGSFAVTDVKLELRASVPVQRGQVMDDNVSSRSNRRPKSKRQRESAELEENGHTRKHVKKPRGDANLVKGKYPRKLGSTAKSPKQTQTIDVNDVPGVPREDGQVSLNSQRAPKPWSRIVTMAEDCVCYFCQKKGHFASDCGR